MRTVLHTESSPGLGGQEIRTLNEARWIGERGWRVIVAGQPEGRFVTRAREAGLETAPLRMRSPWDLSAVARLTRLIRGEGVSVVHTHSSVDGWLGGLAARAARVPVVRTRHVSIPFGAASIPSTRGWRTASSRAERRSGASSWARACRAGAWSRFPPASTSRPCPSARAGPGRFQDLRLSSPVIGSVAMFRGSKGHAHLLEAFAAVRAVHPTATLLLVGDGIRRALGGGLAREAGLADHVVFTGFSEDVPALLAMMDCFVLASTRTEGVPQSLLQAFAAGVPVVASDIGGVPEVVADGVTGLLAESGSASGARRGHRASALRRAGGRPSGGGGARARRGALLPRGLDQPAAPALRRALGGGGPDAAARRMKEARPLVVLHLVANRWWTGSADPVIQLVRGLGARGHRVLLGLIPGAHFEDKAREAGITPCRACPSTRGSIRAGSCAT